MGKHDKYKQSNRKKKTPCLRPILGVGLHQTYSETRLYSTSTSESNSPEGLTAKMSRALILHGNNSELTIFSGYQSTLQTNAIKGENHCHPWIEQNQPFEKSTSAQSVFQLRGWFMIFLLGASQCIPFNTKTYKKDAVDIPRYPILGYFMTLPFLLLALIRRLSP